MRKCKPLAGAFNLILFLCLPFAALCDPLAPAFHKDVTREALARYLADSNLSLIIASCDGQSKPGEGSSEPCRRFDGASASASLSYMERERTRALNCAREADSSPLSRANALRHFGLMLHAAQDFYTRSNYLELALEDPAHREDPYNIPLVDWSRVPDGYARGATGNRLTAASGSNLEDELNKESPMAAGGKKTISGKTTYHSVARELAVRETQRQWDLFEALLRARLGGRSAAVIAALRQAGVDPSVAGRGADQELDY